MGWIIFAVYLVCGILFHIFYKIEKTTPKDSKEHKIAKIVIDCIIAILCLGLLILALYAIGWIWYFFCGSFLLFEDQPFWDKVACGFISLVLLGFVVGFIMVCCGWDPDDRH